MAKKKGKELTLEEKLEQALVPREEWPYEVPENWCWTYMKNVARWGSGGTPSRKHSEYYNGTIPWIKTGELNNQYIYDTEEKITEEAIRKSSAKIFPQNSVIIAMYGATIGKVGILGIPATTNQACACAESSIAIYYKYLFFYALSQREVFIAEGKGGAQPNISQNVIKNHRIPLPPLPEQQRIVEYIENLYAKLDEAKEMVQAVLDESEKRKAAILHKAFSGELTEKWRKKKAVIQNTSFKDYNAKTIALSKKEKKIINTFQAEVESFYLKDGTEWYKCSIGAISIVSNGSTPSRKCQEYWGGDIHWVSSGEVNNNIITDTREKITKDGFDNSSVKLLPAGTVLIAMIGEGKTRGRSSILNIPATTNQNIAAIQVESTCVDSKFLWYWLQMQYKKNREKGSGTGPQALNCQRVRELEFIVPSINEQREISMIIDKLIKVETEISIIAEEFVEKIDIIKKSILAKAFRGELGTNDLSEQTSIELLKEIL